MSEFTKIAIAFLLGIAAEPIRAMIMGKIHLRKLRRAIYTELAIIHSALRQSERREPTLEKAIELRLNSRRLQRPSLDTYRAAKTKPEFYSLPDAGALDQLFCAYEFFIKNPPPEMDDDTGKLSSARHLLYLIDRCLKDGTLNDDIFREVYPNYTQYLAEKEKESAAVPGGV